MSATEVFCPASGANERPEVLMDEPEFTTSAPLFIVVPPLHELPVPLSTSALPVTVNAPVPVTFPVRVRVPVPTEAIAASLCRLTGPDHVAARLVGPTSAALAVDA